MGSETRHRRSEGQAWAADTSSADGVLPCSGAPTMTLWPPRRAAPLTSIRQACPTEAPSLHLAPCPAHLHSALGRGWGIPCAAQRVSGRGSSYILGCRWLLIRDSDLEQGRPRDSFKWVTGSLGHGRGWAAMSMLPPTQGSPGVAPGCTCQPLYQQLSGDRAAPISSLIINCQPHYQHLLAAVSEPVNRLISTCQQVYQHLSAA